MDILSDVLRAVRLTGAIFFDNYVQAPFVGGSPHTATIAERVMPEAEHVIQFHALLSGSCWAVLTEDPANSTRLDAGDIVIFPMGDGNVMSSAPGMHAEPNLDMYVRPTDRRLPFVFTTMAQAMWVVTLCAATWVATRGRSIRCSNRCRGCFAPKCLQPVKAGWSACFASPLTRANLAAPAARRCWRSLLK